jgi:AsmA protein
MPDQTSRPPRRRWLRWALIALSVLVLLPAAGLAVFIATFDAESQKPRIQAAVQAATGRALTLDGPIGVKFALVPTLTLEDVALANAPGGSRPQMATVRRIEVELALLPLLSRQVEVRRLVLQQPDILLETDASGRPNWVFAPEGTPPAGSGQPAPAQTPADTAASARDTGQRLGIAVNRVTIEDGRVGWRDGQTGQTRALAIPSLETRAYDATSPMRLAGRFALDGTPFTLEGETGSLATLTDPSPADPWPLRLVLQAAGARIAAEGEVAQPLQASGWRLALDATVPELQRLAPLVPDVPLPPLRDISLTASLADSGAALPVLSDLRLTLGPAVLDALLPGLRLASLTASLPRQDQPLTLAAEAALNGVPLRLAGTLGAPMVLLPGTAARPWPVDLALSAGAATATLQGSIADARAVTGVDLVAALRVPELAALSPLAGTDLPPVRDIALDTRVAERGPAFAGGAFLRELRFTSSAADAAGELIYVVGQRRGIAGDLTSRRVDLDALRTPAATPAAAPAAAPAPPPAAQDDRVIPDLPLPLEALRVLDADLRWQVAALVAGGVTYQEVRGALSVQNGKGRLDPLTAMLPGGRISLRGAADVTTTPPTVQLAARSEQIDLAVLLPALGQPAQVAGLLGLDIDLRGQGRDLRAVAGSAHGHVGASLVRGQVSARVLDSVPVELRRLAVPPGQTAQDIGLRCLALRLQVEDGMARSRALLVETSVGRVGGEGGLNLGTEALAFRLLPDLRLGGITVRAPVNVAGTLRTPRIGVSPEAAGGLGAFLSLQQTPDRNLQALAEAVGGSRPALPECEPQLAIARGGQPGPAPAAAPAAPAAEAPASPTESLGQNLPEPAQELLRGLFGRGR